ncbi:Brassinosteroid insensitive 1-associated receptor kinase 1 precursor [Hibiscus syriacus]|uniref:Brassinosteroid insensitive 1-associated receptor kinase 1 n=1 Tax=Hibiscus syriacus TaxID=106335 RepID=A0A6A2YLU0_HIBSY|nr:Brassinosteroid insensitive 1-associated receptor kinase 1 precursor [Hibiscus syriacus]
MAIAIWGFRPRFSSHSYGMLRYQRVPSCAMLDTGNFVIASENSVNLWESFKYPTGTILPNQELDVNGSLFSALAETNYRKGKYQLRFDQGYLILNQIDMFTEKPYKTYYPLDLNYYRATLGFDGVFTLYSNPRNPSDGGGGSWSLWFRPHDICRRFVETTAALGAGPCGYNSICEPINGRPNCTCPPGFSFLDEKNPYTGRKQDYTSYPEDCNTDGSTIDADRFEFERISFSDFRYSDYGILQPATELECRQPCLLDCSCAVAILQDPSLSSDRTGTCWKKKYLSQMGGLTDKPLIEQLYLRYQSQMALGKTLTLHNPVMKIRIKLFLILSVLLGTSAIFNFMLFAAISSIWFCLYRRRLRDADCTVSKAVDQQQNSNADRRTRHQRVRCTRVVQKHPGHGQGRCLQLRSDAVGDHMLQEMCRNREEEAILTEWAYDCYSEGMIEKLVQNDEESRKDLGRLEMQLKVAIWCVQYEPLLSHL